MSVDAEVFIIGAGPAGLTTAYCLTKDTPSVLVIEKDPTYVGGISRTVSHNGFLFDIGGHRFFSKSKEIVDLWHEILPDDFIDRPRLSRIYYGGKYYAYPLRAFEALKNLGVFTSARCLLSYGVAKLKPIAEPRTFHQWVRNQFGELLFQIFFKTYTEKVWGMSCDDISADWAAQRIKGLDLRTAIVNGLWRSLKPNRRAKASGGAVVKTLIETFQYPRRGPGMMWDAAARKIEERGGTHPDGARADRRLSYDAAQAVWRIEVTTAAGAQESYTARHVVSSAPIRELTETDRAGADLAPACARAALPRLHHGGPDGQQAGSVSRQLDLHPRSEREGRPHPEFPLMVARDGAGRHELPRAGIFLLRGRRPVDRQRRRADRARDPRSRRRSAW